MKKIILTIAIVFGLSQFLNAQIDLGVGLMEADNAFGSLAIELKADFGITEKISVSPSVDYFIPTSAIAADLAGVDSDSANLLLTISVDGHYHFEINDKFKAYPLAGVNFLITDYDNNNEWWDNYYDFGPQIFVNVGAGATYAFTEKMKAFLELKFTRFGPAGSVGVYFSL